MKVGTESIPSGSKEEPRVISGEALYDAMLDCINFDEYHKIVDGLDLTDEERKAGLPHAAERWSLETKKKCARAALLNDEFGAEYRRRFFDYLKEENLSLPERRDDEREDDSESAGSNDDSNDTESEPKERTDDGETDDGDDEADEEGEDEEREKKVSIFKKMGQRVLRAFEKVRGWTKKHWRMAAAGIASVVALSMASGSFSQNYNPGEQQDNRSPFADMDPIVAAQNYDGQIPSEKAYEDLTGQPFNGDTDEKKDAGQSTESKESKEDVDPADDLRGYFANADGTAPDPDKNPHNFANGTKLFEGKTPEQALEVISDEYQQMVQGRGAMLWQLAQQGMEVPGYQEGMGMTAYTENLMNNKDLMHESADFVKNILSADDTTIEEMNLARGTYYNEYLSWDNADRCLTSEDVTLFQYPTTEKDNTRVYKITVGGKYSFFIKKICTQVISEIPSDDTPEVTTTVFIETTTTTPETTTRPVETTTTPVETTTVPEETTTKPVETTTTPETTTKPEETTTKPVETTTVPEETTTKPVETTTKPVETTTKPVETTTKPVETTTKPVETTTKPVETTTKPVETTTKPVETTTKPVETTTTPKETTTQSTTTTAPETTATTKKSTPQSDITTVPTHTTTVTETNAPKNPDLFDNWGQPDGYTETFVKPEGGEAIYTTTIDPQAEDLTFYDSTDAEGNPTNGDYRTEDAIRKEEEDATEAKRREDDAANDPGNTGEVVVPGDEPPKQDGTGDGGSDVDILSGIFG